MAQKYRQKSAIVEAMQFTGENANEIAEWIEPGLAPYELPEGWWLAQRGATFALMIVTPHATLKVEPGDWVLRSEEGGVWPCKPQMFEYRYEAVP